MQPEFSKIGRRLGGGSGIGRLMEDLGEALASGEKVRMLGGGQPAQIPEVNEVWERRLAEIAAESDGWRRCLTIYDPPRGNGRFIEALATLFRERFGWPVGPENLAVTTGGQTAFFFLFNLLAGEMEDGRRKQVRLPLVPEYIGYANQGLGDGFFQAAKPEIEFTGGREFKYRVDFDALELGPEIGAVCASRPTNPTGNVLTDGEVRRLAEATKAAGVPLVLDNAYGAPFPNIIFSGARPYWDEHVVLTMSLSKLGLPGTRTGVVVAAPEIAKAIGEMSSVVGLANPNLGQQVVLPLIESGEILRLAEEVVRPFYRAKSALAREWVEEFFGDGPDYYVHRSEGALFLWLWFPGLPVGTMELYERLKRRGVLVVPGEFFFFGLADEAWPHRRECVRVNFAMDKETVREGLRAIAEEVRRVWQER